MLTEEQPRLVGFTRDESRARHRELHQVAHVLDDLSPFSEPNGVHARRATDEERANLHEAAGREERCLEIRSEFRRHPRPHHEPVVRRRSGEQVVVGLPRDVRPG